MNLKPLAFLFALSFLAACSPSTPTETAPDAAKIVRAWNEANSSKDLQTLSGLYASELTYYGSLKPKSACLDGKAQFFKTNPDYHQRISGEITVDTIADGRYRCSFLKSVTIKNNTHDYPSYLVLEKKGGLLLITNEGDGTTDKNIAGREKRNAALKSCEDALIAIAMSAPVIRNQMKKEVALAVDHFDADRDCYLLHLLVDGEAANYTLGWYEYWPLSNRLLDVTIEESGKEISFDRSLGKPAGQLCR